ncbi:unnamed protein product [Dracunculus medinensis]|uniref:Zf-CHCC domain-containing protein n=1 Tax=Dracunculus medinensis TaxID=318479 RepID=A0A0N4U941_DRAME|nr:unnamed protein product [Dracunculus medinensis]
MHRSSYNRLFRIISLNTRWKSDLASPKDISEKSAIYDKVTHTGQAWDQADYRLQRFDFSPKQVNPNIAQNLIAELPPVPSKERVVFCDGGHPALGHPRVYINLDKPGTHACGYCGQRFYNIETTKEEDKSIAHMDC